MNTNINYYQTFYTYSSTNLGVKCTITACMSFDDNPILRAVIKDIDKIKPLKDMLKTRNAYSYDWNIFFTVTGSAKYKGGNKDIEFAKKIAKDKAQLKVMQKARKIYISLLKNIEDSNKLSSKKVKNLFTISSNMIEHIKMLTAD